MAARVLLLGADGQLGQDIRRAHASAGEPFRLLASGRSEIELTDRDATRDALAALDFDTLVNCAAYNLVDVAEGEADTAFAVNATAVRELATVARTRGARLVQISTDYVFGGDLSRRRPLDEATPRAPVNVYGASKAAGEVAIEELCEDFVILRVASLFGTAGVGGRGGNFVETMVRLADAGEAVRVVDDQLMSPTSTRDAAQKIVELLDHGVPAGIYHLVNEGEATWYQFASAIFEAIGASGRPHPCSSEAFGAPAPRPHYSVLDGTKLSARFGPMPHWRVALRDYFAETGRLSDP